MVGLLLAGAEPAVALQVTGSGKSQELVAAQFPPEQRARYEIFKVRCTKCHAMARPIAALQTGITPVTGSTFDQQAIKKYVVKMMRKPNSGISREDAREVLLFLRYTHAIVHGEPQGPHEEAAAE